VWNQTRSDQIDSLRVLTNLFQKYFPGKVIYPTLGNHESSPVNLYPTPNIKEDNISWLYNEIAQDWIITGLPSNLTQNIQK
jgi:sphingomyelin phosphodiesterase